MSSSEHANLPRWKSRPGFFEIWFLVVFDPGAPRAWWLRYTTFAPAPGQADAARATVWAAAFDAQASEPAIALKRILPLTAYDPGGGRRFEVHIGSAELSNDRCRGEVRSEQHHIEWDLRFVPAATEAKRGPWLPHRLPLPTHVAHANSDIACAG